MRTGGHTVAWCVPGGRKSYLAFPAGASRISWYLKLVSPDAWLVLLFGLYHAPRATLHRSRRESSYCPILPG